MSKGKFVATNKSNGPRAYPLIPEDQYPAVLVDIVEDPKAAKRAKEQYGKDGFYFKFVFQTNALITLEQIEEAAKRAGIPVTDKMKESVGKRHLVRSRAFNLTLNEKGALLPFLKSWLGKGISKDTSELDIETLLGVNAVITVEHSDSDDGKATYTNISAIAPMTDRMKKLFEMTELLAPVDYTRVEDRKENDGAKGSTTAATETVEEDDTEI